MATLIVLHKLWINVAVVITIYLLLDVNGWRFNKKGSVISEALEVRSCTDKFIWSIFKVVNQGKLNPTEQHHHPQNYQMSL